MAVELMSGYEDTVSSSPLAALDAVLVADRTARRAEVEKLEAVLAWAHAHSATAGDAASWELTLLPEAADGVDRLGGEGTPAVAEFAVEQLATRLRVSTGSAMQLIADTLDLAHRHPILWGRVLAGACPAWTARRIAAACTTLPAEAAAWIDEQVGHRAGACPWRTVEAKLAYATAKWDPAKTRTAEEQAKDGRHVHLDLPGRNGNAATPGDLAAASLRGRLSTTDALKFDALVAAKAAELAEQGDTSSLDIRRAKALGLIADQLMAGELDLDSGSGADAASPAPRARRSCLPATLNVHVRIEDLLTCLSGTNMDPYIPMNEGGPPGQSHPGNLAPLCRRHHRCKTFTRWRYRRLRSGDYVWTDPHGATHLSPI